MPYLDYRLGRASRKMPDYASISGRFARCFAYFARDAEIDNKWGVENLP